MPGRGAGKGALDDVFGVMQSAAFRKGQASLPDLGLTGLTCDASLTPGAGTAAAMAGTAPLLVANRFGKGRTLLLNFALTPYAKLPAAKGADFADWPAGAPWRAFLRQPLAEAGVRCPVRVEPELPHVEVSEGSTVRARSFAERANEGGGELLRFGRRRAVLVELLDHRAEVRASSWSSTSFARSRPVRVSCQSDSVRF